jgi:hypothetical protein
VNIEQEKLRNQINNLIDKYGIKANHICEYANIDTAYFCRWRKGKKYLSTEDTKSIKIYLENLKRMF